jgi:hypothetical protein
MQLENINEQTVTLKRNGLPAGPYFVLLTEGNNIITTKNIIITD